MRWTRHRAEERGKNYTDHVSEDGRWKCAEGYDEAMRADGFPWSLLQRIGTVYRFVRQFAELADAKAYAADRAKKLSA